MGVVVVVREVEVIDCRPGAESKIQWLCVPPRQGRGEETLTLGVFFVYFFIS